MGLFNNPMVQGMGAMINNDDTANMKGSFSGKLCMKKDFMSETDTSDCLPVEGTFDTALRSGN